MTTIHHIQCGTMETKQFGRGICHCLLLEDRDGLALVDTGVGLQDVRGPLERIGRPLIDLVGFKFDEQDTAVRRIEALGLRPEDVRHIVLTHADCDHVGGLADFPDAVVHVSEEELASVEHGHFRYLPPQLAHGPRWKTHGPSARRWFGLEARPVDLGFSGGSGGAEGDALLVPLFGHTLGHCGVAIPQGDRWVLHVGDGYYLRLELERDDHPICVLAAQRADDNGRRRASLEQLRRLARDHAGEIELFSYHDPAELPAAVG